jgi:AcrR family transcriptional regulator
MSERDSEAASLRTLLVARALEMLERGESDVSLRAVARAAGVSAMAPYRHFADKAALMAAVALRGFRMLHERALAADADADPVRALAAQGLAYVAFAREKPALFRLMFADGAGLALPEADGAGAYDVLAARVATLVPPDRVAPAVLGCWGLVHGLAMLALDGRLAPDPALEARTLGMMTAALTAPGA